MSVLAALIPPGQNGLYGNISPEPMAIEMRPYGVLIADFLARHGQDATPVMSQESSNAVLQVSPVDEAKQAIVDIDPDMQDRWVPSDSKKVETLRCPTSSSFLLFSFLYASAFVAHSTSEGRSRHRCVAR